MGIIIPQNIQAQTPVITKEQKVQRLVQRVKGQSTMQFQQLVRSFIDNYNLVWNNPEGLTPEEVLNGFGKDATSLFQASVALQTMINTIVPGTLTQTALKPVTFNEDGTVTLG